MGKELPKEQLKKKILKFLNERKVLVLCTCKNNIPRATPLDFYNEGLDLYMTPTGGAKVENLKANPIASIGTYAPLFEGEIQGLQITSNKIRFIHPEDEDYNMRERSLKEKQKCF